MKKRFAQSKHPHPVVLTPVSIKWDVTPQDVSVSVPDCPELSWIPIQIDAPSLLPITSGERKQARAKFRHLLRERLPLKGGRCAISIGENMVEVATEKQTPCSEIEIEEVFRVINGLLSQFPEAVTPVTKADIAEDYVE